VKHIFKTGIVIAGLAAVALTQSPPAAPSQNANIISYGLVIDDSGSMLEQLKQIRRAAKIVVANNGADDETFILLFTDAKHTTRLQDFTRDKQTLNEAIDDIYIQGGDTAIIDGLAESARYVADSSSTARTSRRALILLSDGEDRASKQKLDDVLSFIREKHIAVYVIGIVGQLEKDRGKKATQKATEFLTNIAAQTGGTAFFPRDLELLNRNAAEIFQKLRTH